jgi:hypothetical protein
MASGRWGTCYVVGVSQKIPEGIYRGLDIRWGDTGRFEYLRIGMSSR